MRNELETIFQMHGSKVRIVILLPKEFPAPGTLPKNAKVMFILSSCSPELPVAPLSSGCQEKHKSEKLSLRNGTRTLAGTSPLVFSFSFLPFLLFLSFFFKKSGKSGQLNIFKSTSFSFIDCRLAWLEVWLNNQEK